MSFPTYEEYKDSDVEWLGEVPSHWSMPPVYSRYEQVLGKMLDQRKATGEHPTPYVRNVDVQWDQVNSDDLPLIDIEPTERERFTIKNGDLLICEGGEVGRTAIWNGNDGEVAFQKAIHRLRPLDDTEDVRFFFYTMRFATAMQVFLANSNPNTIPHLTGEQLRGYRLPKPPLDEQKAISAFLDAETSKIDSLVTEQQKLIELLKEKRQAVISHAVTKGLNPNAPMKPSGIQWLGEVPEHWNVCRFQHAITFQEGPGILAKDFHDHGIPLVRVSGVKGRWATLDGCNHLDPVLVAKRWEHFRLRKGDLIISASASMGTVSEVSDVAIGAVPYTGLIRLVAVKGKAAKDFIRSLVVSDIFVKQIDLLKAGATIKHFGPTHLRQIRIPLPPEDEQQKIAEYIDAQLAKFDALEAEAERAIDLLQERCMALISAAVTGKIDVREYALQETA